MDDHKLLELAAKASGLKAQYSDNFGDFSIGEPYTKGEKQWNPLTEDGDALRLAVQLKLQITPGTYNKDEFTAFHSGLGEAIEHWSALQDENAATRRAIVRAAAEIGKSMP